MAKQDSTPIDAGVYCRISYDPKGDLLGVSRQEPPCRDLCARKGWRVVEVYVDDDISAYHRTRRPEYERLLADVEAGRIQAIVAWHPDRLTRRPVENERLIDLADRYHVQLATVKVGDHDLATPAGRMQFRMLGVMARYESEHMAERRVLMLGQRAAEGLPHFGGQRSFGYQPGGLELDRAEHDLAREAVERLLRKRETVYAVLNDWRERGVRTPGTRKHPDGKVWSTTPFITMLTSPRLAGLRQHQGEILMDKHGQQVQAAWPAIVTPAEREELLKLFAGRPRRPGRPPKRLLVGVVYCGREGCGRKLVSCWPGDIPGRWAYGCKRGMNQDGCARTFIDGRQLDHLITERVLDRLTGGGGLANAVAAAVADDATLKAVNARAEEDRRALAEADHARYVTRELDHQRYLAVKAPLEAGIAEADRLLKRRPDLGPLLDLPRTEAALRRWWASPKRTLEERRAVIGAVLARVEIRPRPTRRSHFDPSRVVISKDGWKV
jgi:DNA invertase Pin-like site-specific DNA recombinase